MHCRPTFRIAGWIAGFVLFVLPAAAQAPSQAPSQAPVVTGAPRCAGQDLLEEIREQRPEDWARISEIAEATINGRSIFWKIEGPKGPPSHIFGTIHLSDDRINALPVGVQLALGSAKKVALEVADLSPEALGLAFEKLQSIFMFSDGRSLETILAPEEQVVARRAIEKIGMPGTAIGTLKPWVVSMTLSLSDCERRRSGAGLRPLDLRLGDNARQRGVPIVGLETLEDQLRAMAAVPDEDQIVVLRAGLKLYDRTDDLLETMVRRYLARDLGLIWPMQEEIWRHAGFKPSAFASFQHELVTVRNVRMRDAALPLLAEGGVFIAVGALHLPGASGLVELIRKSGYTVTPGE